MTQPIPSYEYQQQVITREEWWLHNQAHRMDGPAVRKWTIVNGLPVLIREEWWLQGKCHRVDGPAHRHWTISGDHSVLVRELWYLRHRLIRPLLLPRTALTLQRWYRRHHARRWSFITAHLRSTSLIVFPGLIPLLQSY